MLAFESVLFVWAIVKAFKVAQQESQTPKILAVLLRDSTAYFGGMFAIILTNLIIWSAARVCEMPTAFWIVADLHLRSAQMSLVSVAIG